ncbi:hypothetical protein [uncultured Bacteroides sp.]|uniref:hypothetical protein n=1 Tax=uncultured Bacteroides sp. TaxID=162156 RepID=UPI002592E71B|nr:hypothetical protein [uncultured Bacteroides sp.]
MKVEYSKDFEKTVRKLSGKLLDSVREVIRTFFIFHVEVKDDTVKFKYLVPRGEAYAKKSRDGLRKHDI